MVIFICFNFYWVVVFHFASLCVHQVQYRTVKSMTEKYRARVVTSCRTSNLTIFLPSSTVRADFPTHIWWISTDTGKCCTAQQHCSYQKAAQNVQFSHSCSTLQRIFASSAPLSSRFCFSFSTHRRRAAPAAAL